MLFRGHEWLLPWLLFWPIPILKLKIVSTASFLRSILRGLKAETNELLAKRFYLKLSCEMVRTPYKRVNVLSFEMSLIILSFRLLENQTY